MVATAFVWREFMRHLAFACGLLTSGTAIAAIPEYEGQLCLVDGGARLEVMTDHDVSLVLVYPTPPGGGWMMTMESPGHFSHDLSGLSSGDDLTFNLVIQNPTQHAFPEHQLTVSPDCVTFERDDVTPPPPRGFRHEIQLEESGIEIHFESGANGTYLGDTTSVIINYRLADESIKSIPLTETDQGEWSIFIPEANAGDAISYWFTQQIDAQTQDTALLDAVIGEATVEPDWPIISRRVGRFRHRHPNEWRFDNYVEDYGVGKSYEMTMTDWGTRVDITLDVDEDLPVNRVDFRYFTWNDPFTTGCHRPETLVNQIMQGGQNHFTYQVDNVTPGTIIDFDLTFIELPTPGLQYYSEFFYYRVGQGRFGPHVSDPRISPVGAAAESHVYSPRFGFAQHASTLTLDELKSFMDGKLIFETDFENADLLNFTTHFTCCAGPIGQTIVESPGFINNVIGPRYAAASCIQCHNMDGRGATPFEGEDLVSLVAQTSIPGMGAFGEPVPHPFYGSQLDVAAEGETAPEGRLQVVYEEIDGSFDDGTPYSLRKPTYRFIDMNYGSLGSNIPDEVSSPGYGDVAHFSPRIAPMLPGLGMLEAISETEILLLEDPDDVDEDGISGRANWVWDQTTQKTTLGRFGWKANQPNIRQQASEAFRRDLGITTPLAPWQDCGELSEDCDPGDGLPELDVNDLDLVESYIRGLTLPPRRNYEDPMAMAGMHLFKQAGCQSCHRPTLRTGSQHPIEGFRNQLIEPFTDLLLHDMGPELADNRPHYQASGSEWRTPPLWALSYVTHALGLPENCDEPESGGAMPNFLHDGRARNLSEAILWHGGEASGSRTAYLAMDSTERSQLLAFVAYPFADPIFNDIEPTPPCRHDIDESGQVDVMDVLLLLGNWGQPGIGDTNDDGIVDTQDILDMLKYYGQIC
tara:strand:+ start:8327 stop:11086 length:2760 start_codon:yes stop_codon:yes gene_type:complete